MMSLSEVNKSILAGILKDKNRETTANAELAQAQQTLLINPTMVIPVSTKKKFIGPPRGGSSYSSRNGINGPYSEDSVSSRSNSPTPPQTKRFSQIMSPNNMQPGIRTIGTRAQMRKHDYHINETNSDGEEASFCNPSPPSLKTSGQASSLPKAILSSIRNQIIYSMDVGPVSKSLNRGSYRPMMSKPQPSMSIHAARHHGRAAMQKRHTTYVPHQHSTSSTYARDNSAPVFYRDSDKHIEMERRRRIDLRETYTQLCRVLPQSKNNPRDDTSPSPRLPPRQVILQEASDFIIAVEHENNRLEMERRELIERQRFLSSKLMMLTGSDPPSAWIFDEIARPVPVFENRSITSTTTVTQQAGHLRYSTTNSNGVHSSSLDKGGQSDNLHQLGAFFDSDTFPNDSFTSDHLDSWLKETPPYREAPPRSLVYESPKTRSRTSTKSNTVSRASSTSTRKYNSTKRNSRANAAPTTTMVSSSTVLSSPPRNSVASAFHSYASGPQSPIPQPHSSNQPHSLFTAVFNGGLNEFTRPTYNSTYIAHPEASGILEMPDLEPIGSTSTTLIGDGCDPTITSIAANTRGRKRARDFSIGSEDGILLTPPQECTLLLQQSGDGNQPQVSVNGVCQGVVSKQDDEEKKKAAKMSKVINGRTRRTRAADSGCSWIFGDEPLDFGFNGSSPLSHNHMTTGPRGDELFECLLNTPPRRSAGCRERHPSGRIRHLSTSSGFGSFISSPSKNNVTNNNVDLLDGFFV